jgi:hypothetical protein
MGKIRSRFPFLVRNSRAFTIIEIALCLGIIAFAMIAILGVLPLGLSVQKENREETIINQEAVVWMDAIRNGSKGYDDLTNYILAITNVIYSYNGTNFVPPAVTHIFTHSEWTIDGVPQNPPFLLTNAEHIIGLLSKPTIWPPDSDNHQSNYLTAAVRAISGSAVEKAPQDNPQILGDAFSYRLIMGNFYYVPFETNSIDLSPAVTNGMNAQDLAARLSHAHLAWSLRTNSHDLRLTFRWPFLPNGELGNGRQTFRALTGGRLVQTNSHYAGVPNIPLFFFQPATYTTNSL